jgi:hypothetical protein
MMVIVKFEFGVNGSQFRGNNNHSTPPSVSENSTPFWNIFFCIFGVMLGGTTSNSCLTLLQKYSLSEYSKCLASRRIVRYSFVICLFVIVILCVLFCCCLIDFTKNLHLRSTLKQQNFYLPQWTINNTTKTTNTYARVEKECR